MHQDDQDVQYKVRFSTWKKIISIIFKSKKHLILLIVYSGLLATLDVLTPMFNRYAIDVFLWVVIIQHGLYMLLQTLV